MPGQPRPGFQLGGEIFLLTFPFIEQLVHSRRKEPMTKIETFAEQYRLKVTRDECTGQIIQGRRGLLVNLKGLRGVLS